MMEQQYVDTVKEHLNGTAGEAVKLTIDLRNVFTESSRVCDQCSP